MRALAAVAIAMVAFAAACGGKKEPMVPDGPEMNVPEGGVDDPAPSASAAPSAAPAK